MKLPILALAATLGVSGTAAAQDSQAEANRAFTVYPKESLERGEQGTVNYRVKIDRKGRPSQCEITRSSGFHRLDLATCSLLMERGRFTPKRDGSGRSTRSTHEGKVTWRLS